ncbi:MAG: hypothetical protein AAF696_32135 [Bacteroidota bacterium]
MNKAVRDSLRQILLIVFSVVLGILLSERIEENKKEREAALIFSKIKSEVHDNKELLAYWVPYHGDIVNHLDSLIEEEEFINNFIENKSSLFDAVLTRGSLMSDMPAKDAWDIAKSHPLIVHFDYEDLLLLSRIYNQQAVTYEAVPNMMELFLAADFNAREKAKANLQSFTNQLREVFSRELQLLAYLQEAEKVYGLQEE